MTGNRVWMLGVTLAAIVIVALGWFFAISPAIAQADLANSQAQNADAQNAAQRIALVRLKNQYDNLPKLRAELDKLQVAVPETSKLDDFLDQLQLLAQSAGVSITGFTAAEATLYGGGEAAAATPATPAPPADGADASKATPKPDAGITDRLYTIPISVTVTGTPAQVMAFTDAAQKGGRFFLVTGDTFTGSRDHPEDDGGTLTGFVFVVKDAPSAATTTK